ncbi:MAG: (2Fe-2S)-binding protein [Betaproteobacteria bacterium HGW-Betaproteobacteria-12]|nr:MAG: (2Fe-2S)-binding protein [Betaproteobacteria bacterium HGW-Betaproteobacteria-12]
MAEDLRLICAGDDVVEAGHGFRFTVSVRGRALPAFVIRYRGMIHGYLNECGHVPAELDWQPGEFFDSSKLYLICSIHGALYAPESGRCLGGRCQGKGLKPLVLREIEGNIYLDRQYGYG